MRERPASSPGQENKYEGVASAGGVFRPPKIIAVWWVGTLPGRWLTEALCRASSNRPRRGWKC